MMNQLTPLGQEHDDALASRRIPRARGRRWLIWAVMLMMSLAWLTRGVAQNEVGPLHTSASSREEPPPDLFEIIRASGVIGLLILALSLTAVALVIEQIFTLRQTVLMPPELADELRAQLARGQVNQSLQTCREQPSVLSHVVQAGLSEADGGWQAVEKAAEDALAEQSARLGRKIEYLGVIGNTSTMLGLLGTVVGLIMAFREVANTEGVAQVADLARGIYLALVTTVMGLVVAIPAFAALAICRNRVDQLMAETAYAALHALRPLKRVKSAHVRAEQPPPLPSREAPH